jgi:hypothetical protein
MGTQRRGVQAAARPSRATRCLGQQRADGAGGGCAPSSLSCQTAWVRLSGRAASERSKAQLGATCTPGSAGVAHLPPPAFPLSSAICGARDQRLERSAVEAVAGCFIMQATVPTVWSLLRLLIAAHAYSSR